MYIFSLGISFCRTLYRWPRRNVCVDRNFNRRSCRRSVRYISRRRSAFHCLATD